jgi:hypothetical protein
MKAIARPPRSEARDWAAGCVRVPCHGAEQDPRDVRSSVSSAAHGALLDHASSSDGEVVTAPYKKRASPETTEVAAIRALQKWAAV